MFSGGALGLPAFGSAFALVGIEDVLVPSACPAAGVVEDDPAFSSIDVALLELGASAALDPELGTAFVPAASDVR